ncbi:MAG: SIMPL domain-containing protein, partial [Chloroflexota bacterium]
AGATTVNGVSFDVADRTAAEAKAREAAMADAKAKADTLSKAAGIAITGVASISESVSTPIWYAPEMSAVAGAARDAATPVMPGSTDVTITVQVSYLID